MKRALLLSLMLIGCGSNAATHGTPADLLSAEQRLEAAFCQYEARCGLIGASEEKQCEASAMAAVASLHVSSFSGWIEYVIYDAAIATGRTVFDPNIANTCIPMVANAPCGTALSAAEQCLKAFKGTVAIGGTCSSLFDCASGLCIPPNATACTGTCQGPVSTGGYCADFTDACVSGDYCSTSSQSCTPLAGAGVACEWLGSIATCQPGFSCDPLKKTCQPIGGVGAMCSFDDQCQQGLRCGVMLKCAVPVADGGACTYNEDCQTASTCVGASSNPPTMGTCRATAMQAGAPCPQAGCGTGLFCDSSTPNAAVCRVQLNQGASCSPVDACRDGLVCVGFSSTMPGTCAPWLDVGKSCDATKAYNGCPSDTACANGSCQLVGTVGSSCSRGGCRPLLYCDPTQKCSPQVGLGAACTPSGANADSPCALGQCDPITHICAASTHKCSG